MLIYKHQIVGGLILSVNFQCDRLNEHLKNQILIQKSLMIQQGQLGIL